MLYEYQVENNVKPAYKLEDVMKSEGMDPAYTYSCLEEGKRQQIVKKVRRVAVSLFKKCMILVPVRVEEDK